jgi:hypothetical protein
VDINTTIYFSFFNSTTSRLVAPRTVLVVRVKEAYMHCSRALVRADLWNPAKFAAPGSIPSYGTMLAKHTCGLVDAQKFDEENRVRVPQTLY